MIYDNVLECIGNTPLVRYSNNILLKLEYFNPSGSVKDRASYSMIQSALERGDIDEDTVIIEPTSGNTGIGLAMVCAVLGMKLIICMPESMSEERRKLIAAYGAELVLTPKELGMKGAVEKAIELKHSYSNAWIPMQFANPDNPRAHQQTAKEILDDTGRNVDIVVAGIGTGGTAFGLKEYLPNVQVYGVEPAESPLFTDGKAGPHKIQGIGANFIPEICEGKSLDGILTVEGDEAIVASKRLAKEHGIFCGISAGAALLAAEELAQKYPEKLIVAIVPDTGERYLSC
ncbi:MAG: cysteine synthase A [Candidatus Gastranaerophilales bacterium]|nr:cysteine synthase A [Candidatus Gastranaerophilales bacterium]